MGSGAETVARDRRAARRQRRESRRGQGAPVPAVLGRSDFVAALPKTVKRIAVLDRTKEPGALGEPLYLDVVAALRRGDADGWSTVTADAPRDRRPLRPVVQGIHAGDGQGGVRRAHQARARSSTSPSASTTTSPHCRSTYDPDFDVDARRRDTRVFYGLGVGRHRRREQEHRSRSSAKSTDNYAQGYFVYDSKKAGAMTVSHLRFGPTPIRSTYLIRSADFVACHQFDFLDQIDVLDYAEARRRCSCSTRPCDPDEVWDQPAARSPAADHRQEASRSTRSTPCTVARRRGHGRAHQHDHADLLLRDLRRAAAGRGDRRDQGRDQENLRQARRRRCVQRNYEAVDAHAGEPASRSSIRTSRPRLEHAASRSCRPTRRISCSASPP